MTRVAVVGGGISGLAAAHRLRTLLGPDTAITVLEQRDRLGGVLRTVDLAGAPFDVGAEAFLVRRPEMLDLLDELGLSSSLTHPTPATATIRAGGRTVRLPRGTLMGVPGRGAELDGVLSAAGLAAVAAEPSTPLKWEPGGDIALGGLLRERFGPEVVDRIADPLLGGVYAGRVDTLGLRATVPALAAALDAGASSVSDAATAGMRSGGQPGGTLAAGKRDEAAPPAGPVFGAVRGGYREVVAALVAASAATVRTATTVRALERRATGWRLVLGPVPDPEILDVDAVVLAVPAPALRRLLEPVVPAAAAAAARIDLASSAVVALAYRPSEVPAPPVTSGCLVAADEPLSVKGVTHASTKWAHLGEDGLIRLRASVGRFGEEANLQIDDGELVARVRADLAELDGIEAAPVASYVQRWGGGLPQYGVGHTGTVAALESAIAAEPGLAVAGSLLHGVGLPACVGTARAAAERVAAAVPTTR
ncbi:MULTISPECIES: protoporphyrinogen oxidase [Pseudonocardia]|uniref:Coproporphyrinogen III oxidase n=2 Tax=Pseudonocardia TaxID=1847 RepID=A0A1Y2MZC8_PSEAH|nr:MULTISPECIES: protoporphyrinogen oxidase [Pseudonocardia]OSY40411.1 Protoporphyrinogen oxidase [Pseudonocardia autotrophica]TDN72258.1 oxygen-dependent protoporphyrinogen oxidase [Pseudonocardia autotrophica]BBG02970.1 protoporphyrinogen oxidase [Pseudonocardia autotrophica]GEC25129.1 protoporphyrinogen oxidase [Pseudonocardia saturnea]